MALAIMDALGAFVLAGFAALAEMNERAGQVERVAVGGVVKATCVSLSVLMAASSFVLWPR